jgi:hypothetical protein
MSWVTIIWSMSAAVSLTLGAIHVVVWLQDWRAWANLLFGLLPRGYYAAVPAGYRTVAYAGYTCRYVGGIYYRPVMYQGTTAWVVVP